MSNKIVNAIVLSGVIGFTATASPTPKLTQLARRWESGVDCIGSAVDPPPGLLLAIGSDGTELSCDELPEARSEMGIKCFMTTDNHDELGKRVKCPGDPAPQRNPDGSPAEIISDGLMQSWCDASGGGIGVGIANIVGCMLYGYYEGEGDPVAENTSGAAGVCDVIFAGACTWFMDISPGIAYGMDRPCIDDTNSNACAFAAPGK